MAETTEEKIVVIATHAGEDPERATFPFVVANAALAMDVKAVICLQGDSVNLAVKGGADNVNAAGLPPLKDLMASYFAQGGELLLCTPCLKSRNITSDMLVQGATAIAAGRVVQECLEAKSVLNY
jgi:uncharacterized protein